MVVISYEIPEINEIIRRIALHLSHAYKMEDERYEGEKDYILSEDGIKDHIRAQLGLGE